MRGGQKRPLADQHAGTGLNAARTRYDQKSRRGRQGGGFLNAADPAPDIVAYLFAKIEPDVARKIGDRRRGVRPPAVVVIDPRKGCRQPQAQARDDDRDGQERD